MTISLNKPAEGDVGWSAGVTANWNSLETAVNAAVATLRSDVSAVTKSSTGDGMTYTLPAGTLSADGDYVEIELHGFITGFTGTTVIKFGTASLVSITNTSGGASLWWRCRVARTGATTQTSIGFVTDSVQHVVTAGSPTQTLADALTIKSEVTSYTGGSITFYQLLVRLGKAP